MLARLLTVDVGPDRIDAVVAAYRQLVRPIHARARGLRRHYVLVDRTRGSVEIIGIWDSAEALAAIAPDLEPARQRLWSEFGRDPALRILDVADELEQAP